MTAKDADLVVIRDLDGQLKEYKHKYEQARTELRRKVMFLTRNNLLMFYFILFLATSQLFLQAHKLDIRLPVSADGLLDIDITTSLRIRHQQPPHSQPFARPHPRPHTHEIRPQCSLHSRHLIFDQLPSRSMGGGLNNDLANAEGSEIAWAELEVRFASFLVPLSRLSIWNY
jgi:hypothetical protein